jgi:predicted nucleic acid-binding protein
MTPIVVDASALVEYLLRTARGRLLESIFTRRETDLHIPALCDVEVAAVLRRGLLGGRLQRTRAAQVIEDLRDLPLTRHGHQLLVERILLLGQNLSAYDATYVALAERLDAALLTADDRLTRAVQMHSSLELL